MSFGSSILSSNQFWGFTKVRSFKEKNSFPQSSLNGGSNGIILKQASMLPGSSPTERQAFCVLYNYLSRLKYLKARKLGHILNGLSTFSFERIGD